MISLGDIYGAYRICTAFTSFKGVGHLCWLRAHDTPNEFKLYWAGASVCIFNDLSIRTEGMTADSLRGQGFHLFDQGIV